MKLYIQEKLFTLKNKFSVKDELGNDKYIVEGELFSLGKRLHVKDLTGNEIALVKQKILTLLPRFYVVINNSVVAQINKMFTFFSPRYTVRGVEWAVEGDFTSHHYSISKSGIIVATINKKWVSWGDSFELDIVRDEDVILALAVVLAIDSVTDANARKSD